MNRPHLRPILRSIRVLWHLRGWWPPDRLGMYPVPDLRTGRVVIHLYSHHVRDVLVVEPHAKLGRTLFDALEELASGVMLHDTLIRSSWPTIDQDHQPLSREMMRAGTEFEAYVDRMAATRARAKAHEGRSHA